MSALEASAARLYTPQSLSELLGVPIKTLYAWHTKKTGPKTLRVGKHLRYRPQDVESWLEGRAR